MPLTSPEGPTHHTMHTMHTHYTHPCRHCGDAINPARSLLGYRTCLPCGELDAKETRKGWCIAPMNKSNYMLITDPSLLSQLNPKRTL